MTTCPSRPVRGIVSLTSLWLAFVMITIMPTNAQTDLPDRGYEVAGVRVDQTAETAVLARDAAIEQGQLNAFNLLLRRMTLPEDHKRLPKLSASAAEGFVETIAVENERYSTVRYIADLTVGFNAEAVRNLLERLDIPYADSLGRSIVVLPVYEEGGATVLWENPNPWRTAWTESDWRNSLVPFVMPRGSLADTATVSAAQARTGNGRALDMIGNRYGTSEILVPVARRSVDLQTGEPVLVIDLQLRGVAGTQQSSIQIAQKSDETEAVFLARAAQQVANTVADELKQQAIAASGETREISAYADITSLDDFMSLKHRLQQAPMVRGMRVNSMSAQRVLMNLSVAEPFDESSESLIQYGIDLAPDDIHDAGWKIGLRR